MTFFISRLAEDPFGYFSWIAAVAFSICFHEYSHARMAYRYGDDTAAASGHLSLNPFVQMGPTSLIMLFLIGIAWGSVPVNPNRIRSRRGEAVVAFAGPGANLLLCLVFGGMAVGLARVVSVDSLATRFFLTGATANGVLFLLNMLPVPMFDGWSIFAYIFPFLRRVGVQQKQTMGWVFLLLIFMTRLGTYIWIGGAIIARIFLAAWNSLLGLFF